MTMIAAAASQKRSGRPFIIKVNHTEGFTVTLPLYNFVGYNYNFIVDWGDGAVSQVTSATDTYRIHTYASGGTYTITMTGTLEGWAGSSAGLKEYIIEVVQWGRTGFKRMNMLNCTRLASCSGKLITSQTDYSYMFQGCTSLVSCDVSEWDVSKVTTFGTNFNSSMFSGCTKLETLDCSSWVFNSTSNINFIGVFYNCQKLTTIGDVSGWNTGKIINLKDAFNNCKLINSLDVSDWDVSKVLSFQTTFADCKSLTSLDVSIWDISSCTNLLGTFIGCSGLTSLDVSDWNVSKVTTFGNGFESAGTFEGCTGLTSLDCSAWTFNTTSNVSFGGVFRYCTKLTTVGDTSGWDTSKFTKLHSAFYHCDKLTSVDVSGWDVSNVTDFGNNWNQGTFGYCTSLTSLDTSAWTFNSTSNIIFSGVFYGCTALTTIGNTANWNTGKITTFHGAFTGCGVLSSLDVSGWDVSSCTNFGSADNAGMFAGCSSLTSLDVSAWTFNTTSNISLVFTFAGCSGLTTLDVGSWNTGKFYNLYGTFYNCSGLVSLDVSGWDTSSIVNLNMTFQNCTNLVTINTGSWNTSAITSCGSTFRGCTSLTTAFTASKWWSRSPAISSFALCFRGATNISNYADIPTAWK